MGKVYISFFFYLCLGQALYKYKQYILIEEKLLSFVYIQQASSKKHVTHQLRP